MGREQLVRKGKMEILRGYGTNLDVFVIWEGEDKVQKMKSIRGLIGLLRLKKMITLTKDACSSRRFQSFYSFLLHPPYNTIINVFNFQKIDNIFRQLGEQISSHLLQMGFHPLILLSRKNWHFLRQIDIQLHKFPSKQNILDTQSSLPFSFSPSSFLLSFFLVFIHLPQFILMPQHIYYYLFRPPMHNLLLLFFLASLSLAIFLPERLSIVDHDQKLHNYLVRGNLPMSHDHKFQMDELKRHLSNLTGLDRYHLVVISFLNFLTAKQTKNRYIQEKYFDKNPTEGEYSQKLILGSLLDPFRYAEPISKILSMVSYVFNIDDIDNFVTELHDKVHKKGKNTIVFIHCSAGMDRTGYVAGSYKLKYMDYTLKEVLKENSKFGGPRKSMHFNALNGLKWFCFSHKEREQCIAE